MIKLMSVQYKIALAITSFILVTLLKNLYQKLGLEILQKKKFLQKIQFVPQNIQKPVLVLPISNLFLSSQTLHDGNKCERYYSSFSKNLLLQKPFSTISETEWKKDQSRNGDDCLVTANFKTATVLESLQSIFLGVTGSA